MKTLANRLIDMKKNFDEAYVLLDKATKLASNKWDSFDFMDSKLWAFTKRVRTLKL